MLTPNKTLKKYFEIMNYLQKAGSQREFVELLKESSDKEAVINHYYKLIKGGNSGAI